MELEIPLLDVARRRFLLFRNYESLTEMLPMPEDDEVFDEKTNFTTSVPPQSKTAVGKYFLNYIQNPYHAYHMLYILSSR